jgi:hypothetical protein
MSEARKDIAQWLAIRKKQAKKIDPKTAKVTWVWGQILDPYGVHELRPEEECIGRLYFARAPDSDVWVSFDDLAEPTRNALWENFELCFEKDDELFPF